MARKRMIDPNIWQSEDFGNLSDLAQLIFIGLFSLADDEGRGRCNPIYLKSTLFPYKESLKSADIEVALFEISQTMSIIFYSCDERSYYSLYNWNKWQKIDKPSKSKLPKYDETSMQKLFENNSTNIQRNVDECSTPNKNKKRIEENKNKKEIKKISKKKNPDAKLDKKSIPEYKLEQSSPETEGKQDKQISFNELIDNYTTNEDLRRELKNHLAVRKIKRGAMTNRAVELSLKTLDKLTAEIPVNDISQIEHTKLAIVQQSIERGWVGFFEVKDTSWKAKDENKSTNIFAEIGREEGVFG